MAKRQLIKLWKKLKARFNYAKKSQIKRNKESNLFLLCFLMSKCRLRMVLKLWKKLESFTNLHRCRNKSISLSQNLFSFQRTQVSLCKTTHAHWTSAIAMRNQPLLMYWEGYYLEISQIKNDYEMKLVII